MDAEEKIELRRIAAENEAARKRKEKEDKRLAKGKTFSNLDRTTTSKFAPRTTRTSSITKRTTRSKRANRI